MTKDKNLAAKEYLNRKIKEAPFNSLTIDFEFAFSANDIIKAFNAGRESVIENASELKWEEIGEFGYGGLYIDVCQAHTQFEDFLIRMRYAPKGVVLLSNNFSRGDFETVEEAQFYATEIHKERIKEVLGL